MKPFQNLGNGTNLPFALPKFHQAVRQVKFKMEKIREFFHQINERLLQAFRAVSQISGDQILNFLSNPMTIVILIALTVGSLLYLFCDWNEVVLVAQSRWQLGGDDPKRMKDDDEKGGPNSGDPDEEGSAPTDLPIPIVTPAVVENKAPIAKDT